MQNQTESELNIKDLWKAVQAELQLLLSSSNYMAWVAPTRAERVDETSLKVVCSNTFSKNRFEAKLAPLVNDTITKITKKQYHLEFVVGEAKEKHQQDEQGSDDFGPLFIQPTKNPTQNKQISPEAFAKSGLNPKYNFDNYITGKNNQLAVAIASAVAEKPGEVYNPVFFYSGVGLGKTHLTQAIGNQILKDNPSANILYCTGEFFTNELIEAIQGGRSGSKSVNAFRARFRKLDVLIIDDIQFIAKKEATQEEFFHTFNALHQAGKQVILTSDRPPRELKNISERITSRFSSGVIADIQSADVETRSAILRNKRDLNRDTVSNDVLDFIAQAINSNIRELEGAYMQVLTFCKTLKQEINIQSAAQALGQSIKDSGIKKPINLNHILKTVCTYYSVKTADIKGKVRTSELVVPRQVTMFLIKDLTDTPLMSIGEFLGGRDHTTVMHGIRKVELEIAETTKTRQDVQNIKKLIEE